MPTEKSTDNQKQAQPSDNTGKKKLPEWLRKTLKVFAWLIGIIPTLAISLLCLVAWILTPERLTPIVEKIANDNLNAEVKIEQVELTVWKTFPNMSVDIKGLDVRSKAFEHMKAKGLPPDADSLLSVGQLYASFNLVKLPLLQFDIHEILIDSPRVNIVAAGDSLNNLMIFPPSEKEEKSAPLIINGFKIRKFTISNNRGLSYSDLSTGANFRIGTKDFDIGFGNDNFYNFHSAGDIRLKMPADSIDQSLPFAMKGAARWDISAPGDIVVRKLDFEIADIRTLTDASVRIDSVPLIKTLDIAIGPVLVERLLSHVPQNYRYGLDAFSSDISISAKFRLTKPFCCNGKTYPTFGAELTIPDCYMENKKTGARINEMGVDAAIDFNGTQPDKSILTIRKILLNGFGIHLDMSGRATNLLKNPNVDAKIAGEVDFAHVLKLIPKEMPFRLSGQFGLDTSLKFALSDLSVNTFHRIKVNGTATLRNLRYTVPADSLLFFARNSAIRFGTNSRFKTKDNEVKNMLMTSLHVDSLIFAEPGLRMNATGLRAGAGSIGEMKNLLDTTNITPLGARIRLERFTMTSLRDSSKIRLRDMEANGSIKRFGDTTRLPLMDFGIHAGRIAYSDRMTFMGLTDGDIDLQANMKPRRKNRRMMARIDSMCRLYPDLSRDSVVALYRQSRRKAGNRTDTADNAYLDLSVDNEFKRIFRQWDMRGSVKAKRGRFFSPYFPLRNKLDDLDLSFSTKKFELHSMTCHAGKSDLSINGEINNINSALLGSRRKPLKIDISIKSDMLDVNELMAAAYKGSNFAYRAESGNARLSLNDIDNEQQIDAIIMGTSDEETDSLTHAILIPKNIVINIDMHNKKAVYSDINLSDLHSAIRMKNGVLSIRDLSGKSSDGNIKLDLVYATADRNDIGMGLSLGMKDIKVGRFMQLVPNLDTIMPMLKGVDGVVNARLMATTKVDSLMNVILPSTNAALSIDGKDLVLLDTETFREISKMLRFKDKKRNMIDSLSVEASIFDSQLDVYPFIIRMDRYKLGIVGWNDFDTNYKYHISVLDSPLFFKFGINLSGNFLQDKMKFRLGKAKLKEHEVARSTLIADTTKTNLFKQMNEIFRRGAEAGLRSADNNPTNRRRHGNDALDFDDRLSRSDSLQLMESGVIERPDSIETPVQNVTDGKRTPRRKSRKPEQTLRKENATTPKTEDNDK